MVSEPTAQLGLGSDGGSLPIGKRIESVALVDNALRFEFEGGIKVELFDDGQSCCESRYMSTDDDMAYYVGATLFGAETRDVPDTESEDWVVHAIQFLDVRTDRGVFTLANHNEHNGYYGGFYVRARAWE